MNYPLGIEQNGQYNSSTNGWNTGTKAKLGNCEKLIGELENVCIIVCIHAKSMGINSIKSRFYEDFPNPSLSAIYIKGLHQ